MSETQADLSMIAQGEEYELLAAAASGGFVLRFKTDQLTAQLHGDDAERFRNDYDTVKLQHPDWKADQLLAQLWDQGGYSWLAAQDG